MITGEQIKAARKLLGWMPSKLAVKAKLPVKVLSRAENHGVATISNFVTIRATLEAAGIEFTNEGEPGVKLRTGHQTR